MNFEHMRLWSIIVRKGFSNFRNSSRGLHSITHRKMSSSATTFEEELLKNAYYEKYAKKIQELQKSPDDFRARVEEFKERKAKQKFTSSRNGGFSGVSQPKNVLRGNEEKYKYKVLNDVMKIDLIQNMDPEEIIKLWSTHFKDKDGLAASIPVDIYNTIHERGKKFPVFVLPLPRGEGYEFFMCQVERNEVHFTSLINYQAHKENAPECLTIVHYTDLQDKGIVLMRGEFNKDVLNAQEAQCLANQFQLYYGKTNEKRLQLLERLNYNPNEFKHMDLVAELECLSLGTL